MLNKLVNYDLYFIHIPKNAGTSFEKEFCKENKGHYTIRSIDKRLYSKTIAIIRNPYSRIISTYNYVKMKKNYWHSDDNSTAYKLHELHEYCNNNTFETFIKELCNSNKFDHIVHLKPQSHWILTDENKIVSKLVRFENLNEDLSEILGKNINLMKINSSENDNECHDKYYTKELKEIVYKKYKKDFEIYKDLLYKDYKLSKYNYTHSWFITSEINKYIYKYISNKKYNILEIGSFEGLSACFFSDILLNNHNSTLDCVDPYIESGTDPEISSLKVTNKTEERFKSNISKSKNSKKINLYKMKSDKFFESNKKKYNLIYIDGCHEPKFITNDMENSFKCLENGGIMWMDDYGGGNAPNLCKIPMDNFLYKYKNQYKIIHKKYQLAIQKLNVCQDEMLKIIFLNNWGESCYELLKRYSKQTPNNKGIWKNLIGVTDIKDADFYIVLGGYNKKFPEDKTIFVKREPDFITKQKETYKHSIDWKEKNCGIVWWINKTYDELKNMPYPNKNKKISCVVSSKHIHRNNLVKKIIKKYPYIDLYGKGHNKEFYGNSYKGELNYDGKCKIRGLIDYQFSIVLENSSQANYFTEKIADAYLSWCVPIYKGCPNINNYFPSKSYNLIDTENDNITNILNKPINIEDLSKARQLILDEYNIWEVIYKEIKKIKDIKID